MKECHAIALATVNIFSSTIAATTEEVGLKSHYCYTFINLLDFKNHVSKLLTTHHPYVQTYFEAIRDYGEKVTELKECYTVPLATAAPINSQPTYFHLPYKVELPSRDGIIWLLIRPHGGAEVPRPEVHPGHAALLRTIPGRL